MGNKTITHSKEKNRPKGDCAPQMEASREIIGKYGRNENLPSIEMVTKMPKIFEVTIDCLIGDSEKASHDKGTFQRIKEFQKIKTGTKTVFFNNRYLYSKFKNQNSFSKI
jgi:ribosome-binding protein aMBF1 (putative translation factor)